MKNLKLTRAEKFFYYPILIAATVGGTALFTEQNKIIGGAMLLVAVIMWAAPLNPKLEYLSKITFWIAAFALAITAACIFFFHGHS